MSEETRTRDELALERTRLALERTVLAYLRTAVAFLAAGVSAIHFLKGGLSDLAGWVLVGLGGATLVVGMVRFVSVRRSLRPYRG